MPVLATYINIFHARPNTASTVLTAVGKIPLIAFDARRFVFHYDKFLLWQGLITVKTAKVTWMPVCIHGTRVFSNIDQLWKRIYRYTFFKKINFHINFTLTLCLKSCVPYKYINFFLLTLGYCLTSFYGNINLLFFSKRYDYNTVVLW